jgi:hypothetical protein
MRPPLGRNRNAAPLYGPGASVFGTPNLLTKTEDFANNTFWIPNLLGKTANTDTSPTGTLTADSVNAVGANATVFQSTSTLSTGNTWTASVWMKASTGTPSVILGIDDQFNASGSNQANFTLGATWQRYSTSGTVVSGRPVGLIITLTTNGTACQLWGAQLQLGSLGTYHPTP